MNLKSSNFSENANNLTSLPTYQAGVAQSTAYRLLMKFTDDAVKPYGITSMHWFMLGTIYDAGSTGITVTQLSKALDTNVPYVTNTLNILESKGAIVRETKEGDSRIKTVKIDPSFVDNIEVIENDLRFKMQRALYAGITPEELLVYIKVLYKMNNSITASAQ